VVDAVLQQGEELLNGDALPLGFDPQVVNQEQRHIIIGLVQAVVV